MHIEITKEKVVLGLEETVHPYAYQVEEVADSTDTSHGRFRFVAKVLYFPKDESYVLLGAEHSWEDSGEPYGTMPESATEDEINLRLYGIAKERAELQQRQRKNGNWHLNIEDKTEFAE